MPQKVALGVFELPKLFDKVTATEAIALAGPSNRIHGYFTLNPAAPDAIARATNALDKLGLHGICPFPAMHRYRTHDDHVQAVCELAAERKASWSSCVLRSVQSLRRGRMPEA